MSDPAYRDSALPSEDQIGSDIASVGMKDHSMLKASRIHLDDVGESYFEHLGAALRIAALMTRAGVSCAIHAIIPALCTTTATRCLAEVQNLFAERRAAKVAEESLHLPRGRLWGS